MFDTLYHSLLWFGSLVGLGSIFLSLIYYGTSQQSDARLARDSNRAETEALRMECLRLREELQQQSVELTRELRNSTFGQLQTLLTNYPSIRQMVQVKPDLPAKNIISMFTTLDNLLSTWGYEPINSAWEQVAYSPQLHQPDSPDIEPGELVYIRFVGYREGERILCPAKVSRNLPGGVK